MKLLSLFISNFGKFSNYEYKFDNFNVLCEDNGFGKSTLVSFIKAMFYGLDSYTSSSNKFVDRKHYYPYNNNKNFGGNIIFEYQNKTYRIERIFDIKSSSKDTLKVFCNDSETEEFKDQIIGEAIFGINKESFEKILFINAQEITLSADNDINAKLNNYVENVGEEFDLNKILEKIKSKQKEQKSIIKNDKERISTLSDEIDNLITIKGSLENNYTNLNTIEHSFNSAKEEYDKANKKALICEKWKQLDKIESEINHNKAICDEIETKYNNEIPTLENVENLINNTNKINQNNQILENLKLTNNEEETFKTLDDKYNNFNNEELKNIKECIQKENKYSIEISKLNTDFEKELPELENHFSGSNINQNIIDSIKQDNNEINKQKEQLKAINKKEYSTEVSQDIKKVNKIPFITISILASLLLIISLINILIKINTIWIVLIIISLIALMITIFLYFNCQNKYNIQNKPFAKEIDNIEYLKKEKEITELEYKIKQKIAIYRYNEDNIDTLIYRLENDYKNYINNLEKKRLFEEEKNKLSALINDSNLKINTFFASYNFADTNHNKALEYLQEEYNKYNNLKEKEDNYLKKFNEINKENAQLKNNIDSFYKKYSLVKDSSFENIKDDIKKYNVSNSLIINKTQEYQKYKEDNNLDIRPSIVDEDLNLLEEKKKEAEKNYNKILLDIKNQEEKIEPLDDFNLELEDLKTGKKEAERKAKLYESLQEELKKADDTLKEKYVAPIKNKFIDYAAKLEPSLSEKIYMNKDYEISFDKEGAFRSYKHLSSGYLSLCALCFRLALIDNMFNKELPFIILDDPFVNLDENHLAKTKELILDLTHDKQIIYCTCHKSRMI